MEKLILEFVACARAADLRISSAEVMDCLTQIELVDVLDKRQFKTVLRANFAKSRREQHRFNHLYHLFFHELQSHDAATTAVSLAEPIRALRQDLKANAPGHDALTAIVDFMGGEPAAYLHLLQEIQTEGDGRQQGPGSNLGGLVRRFPVLRALDRAAELTDRYLSDHADDIHWETRQQAARHLHRRLAVARDLLTREATTPPPPVSKTTNRDDRNTRLGSLSFNALSPAETIRLREAIAQLVRKLKDTVSLRLAVRSRGTLDVKKTLRRSARYQGIPMDIVFRSKPPRKARIVVLCDISGSVWSSARFMLNMLYALQDCFDRVRSFVFVAEVAEVTRFFEDHPVDQAIDKVLNEAGLNYGASTDYGLTLRQFRRQHMDAVNKKTTVIVIGDGRSNYANPEGPILEEIRDRSRRLIWLNPETEQFWYTGDSEMRTYQAVCNEVRPCRNLDQLTSFIKALVL